MYAKEETNYDDLVAGHFPVITGPVTVYEGSLKKGTVVTTRGVAAADAKAKKSITFTGATPVATKKVAVTIGGVKFEYTIANSDTVTDIAAGLKALINNASTGSALVAADNTSGKLELEAKEKGSAGNYIEIIAAPGADSGVTAGDVTVETVGQLTGDELVQIVDAESGTAAYQEPAAVLLEDCEAGGSCAAAFTGEFNAAALIFKEGQSINNFKVKLRKIGIFAKDCV
jgi:hypothetical protein